MTDSSARYRSFWSSSTTGFGAGMIHCGVRWNMVRWPTRSTSVETICTALDPVPITPTRAPSSGTEWSQRAEWNAVPAKVSIPAMSG